MIKFLKQRFIRVAYLVLAALLRILAFAVWMLNQLYRRIPLRVSYLTVLAAEVAKLPGRRKIAQAFKPVVVETLLHRPDYRFKVKLSETAASDVIVLYRIGAYQESSERGRKILLSSRDTALIVAHAFFELGDFSNARSAIAAKYASVDLDFEPDVAAFKALLDLIAGDEHEGLANLARAIRKPKYLCPHQNLAARYPQKYKPTALDLAAGDNGRLFDAYNLAGQRVTHVGEGQNGPRLYGRALTAQQALRGVFPKLSPQLTEFLSNTKIPVEDLRIIPVEWFTQIGHLGMMDMLFRMKELGWWQGRPVFLAYPLNIANGSFLRLFEQYGPILAEGASVDEEVAKELFSLQRWCGMAFNAFELPGGQYVPWQDAGAIMIKQWEQEQRGDPLVREYDRILGSSTMVRGRMDELRTEWGLKPDDWYVCLHLRDAAHYGELSGTGQTHRNAQLSSYLEMIKYITEKGGWVIKLGGPKSPKLPKMPRVIDYARSDHRSEAADLDLIRHARLFVGTTSGLTNVAISFGIPCALVNCITVDAQLWNSRVRFALKPVELKGGRRLSQSELTTEPWRWRVFDAEVLGRFGAVPLDNSSDEILETVKEVEAMERGTTEAYLKGIAGSEELLETWRNQLGLPYFYGNALPSRYYLRKHQSHFLSADAGLLRETPPAPVNSTAA